MTHSDALRVVFFGTPEFAVPSLVALLTSRHTVACLVSQPDRPKGRGQKTTEAPVKRLALAHGVRVLQPERLKDERFLDDLRSCGADLGVVAAYGRVLPGPVLAVPRLGMMNVHPSLLPKYRGAAPVHRAIIAGETTTGVTIMRVVPALDAGPILAQCHRPIGPDETSEAVDQDLGRLGAELLMATIEALISGTSREEPQNDGDSTYAARLTKEEGRIDWAREAQQIHDRVRGLHPWPLACTSTGDRRLIVRRTAVVHGARVSAAPGTVLEAHGADLVVAAGGGTVLRLLELQPEGRRPMSPREFLAGHVLHVGDVMS